MGGKYNEKLGRLAMRSMKKIVNVFDTRGVTLSGDTFQQIHQIALEYSEEEKSIKRRK